MSQKRVLPNFGNNFVKFRPIFKILSLLEGELNVKQKLHNMFSSTRLKNNPHQSYIEDFNIAQSCTVYNARCKWKRYCSTNYWHFHIFCSKCSPLILTQAQIRRRHSSTALSTTPCSIPCQTSNKLTLLQFSDVMNSRLVDALLDAAYKEYLTSSDTRTINKETCVLFVQWKTCWKSMEMWRDHR